MAAGKVKQLSLDLSDKQPRYVAKRYRDLNINQRINVKANSLQGQEAYILNTWRQIYGWDKPGELSEKWYRHHRTNHNRVRTKKTLF